MAFAPLQDDGIMDGLENGADRISYKEIISSIRSLSPSYRAVFNLYVIEGMKHEEIARLLKISVGASKSNLSKARTNLRTIIRRRFQHEISSMPFSDPS